MPTRKVSYYSYNNSRPRPEEHFKSTISFFKQLTSCVSDNLMRHVKTAFILREVLERMIVNNAYLWCFMDKKHKFIWGANTLLLLKQDCVLNLKPYLVHFVCRTWTHVKAYALFIEVWRCALFYYLLGEFSKIHESFEFRV